MSLLSHLRLYNKKRKSSYRGEIELQILRFLCDKNKVSIDVGANKGNYTLEMSKYSKKVLSFEPNVLFNSYLSKMPSNCQVVNKAVSSSNDMIFLHAPIFKNDSKHNMAFISSKEYEEGSAFIAQVEATRLDHYLSEEIGMIKIDVEGAEISVLSTAMKIIENYKPNFLVEGLSKKELKEQLDFFKSYDYIALKIIRGKIYFVKNEKIFEKCREIDRNTIFIPSDNLN